ncbi:MAG TPA: GNAT family N-acetyltransferase [Chloroflexia bacterium]|jgi:GNAT superfamily N-acetyltransferase|nr:GNAT family N-acetyltransferase [Chloroflexia bacterium]
MCIREAGPGDIPAIARVVVDTWRTTYRGILPDAVLANLSYAQREQVWMRALENQENPATMYVAETETGEVVGVASGGRTDPPEARYQGELAAIYILAAYQGHGLGRRLLAAVAEGLAARGLTGLLVWVLADNPACRFYERLGGRRVYEKPVEVGGVPLPLAGYGWADATILWAPPRNPA